MRPHAFLTMISVLLTVVIPCRAAEQAGESDAGPREAVRGRREKGCR